MTNTSFFERQEAARRSTGLLIFYFICAVGLILLAVDAVFYGMARGVGLEHAGGHHWYWHTWTTQALIGTLMLIVGGSAISFFSLREGGHAIARMVNATPVDFSTRDADQRQLINVVEEMAIASGIRVPALYVMEREQGINAFVAGYEADGAVLVVTTGALQHLSRDELQGVIGHEFSHILNGDMRLNIRLVALLAGILALGQIGGIIMRYADDSGYGDRDARRFTFHLSVLGFSLWAIGYIGVFFGRLIKAAVSRQRETLADASSVQFTRNPDGLAGALMKVGEQQGSFLTAGFAESMSHMCFGPALDLSSWFATHPPLEERIRAIVPSDFMPRYRARRRAAEQAPATAPVARRVGPWDAAESPIMGLAPIPYEPVSRPGVAVSPALTSRVGTVRPHDLDAATTLKARLPEPVVSALESSAGARALIYAVIAEQQALSCAEHERFLLEHEGKDVTAQVTQLRAALSSVHGLVTLPLVDLALPRLMLLGEAEARELMARLQAFSRLDRQLSVFEFALLSLLSQQLLPRKPVRGHLALSVLREQLAVVVACLVRHGDLSPEDEIKAYAQALDGVLTPLPAMPVVANATLPQMALALRALAALSPEGKRQLIEICVRVVRFDGRITHTEYELLRVIASLVACPLPLSLTAEP